MTPEQTKLYQKFSVKNLTREFESLWQEYCHDVKEAQDWTMTKQIMSDLWPRYARRVRKLLKLGEEKKLSRRV